MKLSRISVCFLILAFGLASAGTALADVQKFSSELTYLLNTTPTGEKHSMIVHLADAVDVVALDNELYHQKVTRATRHQIVMESLRAAAEHSQGR
jgi:hypothetical protein